MTTIKINSFMQVYNKYEHKGVVLKIGDTRSTYTPYILKLQTTLLFTEKEFLSLCDKLQKKEYTKVEEVVDEIKNILSLSKTEKHYIEIKLFSGGYFPLGSFNIGTNVPPYRELQQEPNITLRQLVFSYFTTKGRKKEVQFGIFDVHFFDIPEIKKIAFELWLLSFLNTEISQTIYLNQTTFFIEFEKKIRKFCKESSFQLPKRIQFRLFNKYNEVVNLYLGEKKCVTEKEYTINRQNYAIGIKYIQDAKDISYTSLSRTSKHSVLDLVRGTQNKKFKVTIIGEHFPITIENIYSSY